MNPIPLAVGITSGLVAGDFSKAPRAELQPPGWVFGVVWTALYVMMGIVLARAKTVPPIFWVQLALNALWSPVYVRFKNPKLAFVILCALCVAVLQTVVIMRDPLLYPYLAWCIFALYLNYSVIKS